MAAEFLYPARGNFSTENDGQMINIYDELFLEYTSVWPSLNVTIFCRRYATSSDHYSFNAYENPMAGSGIYYFGPIFSAGFKGWELPTRCNFKLTKYGDNDNSLNGQEFGVTANTASKTTYSPTVTSTTSASTETSTSTQTTNTATVLSDSASSSVATSMQGATETQASAPSNSSRLSAGAAAGIGVGVGLAVLILAAAIFFMFSRRRKAARTATQDLSPENPPPYAATSEDAAKPADAAKPQYHSQHQQQGPQEMEAISPAELDNGQSFPVHRHELSG